MLQLFFFNSVQIWSWS